MKKHIFKSISLTLGLLLSLSNINTLGMIEDLGTITSNGDFIKPNGTIILPYGKTTFEEIPNDIIRYKILPYLNAKDLVKNIKPVNKKFYELVNNYVKNINEKDIIHLSSIRNIILYMLKNKSFLLKTNNIKETLKNLKAKLKTESHIPITINISKTKIFYDINKESFSAFQKNLFKNIKRKVYYMLYNYNNKSIILSSLFQSSTFTYILHKLSPKIDNLIFNTLNLKKIKIINKIHEYRKSKEKIFTFILFMEIQIIISSFKILNNDKLVKKMDKELGILLRAIYPNKNFSVEELNDLGII